MVSQKQTNTFEHNLMKAYDFVNVNSDSVIFYAKSAFKKGEINQGIEQKTDALFLIINTQIKQGKLNMALINTEKADSIITESGLLYRKPEVIMYKGLIFVHSGFNAEGLEYFFQAEKLIDNKGDTESEAKLNYYFAVAYYKIGNYERSREYARIAASIYLNNDVTETISSYALISSTFTNADSIHKYLTFAEEKSRSARNDYKSATILNNKALFYKSIGKYKQAKAAYLEAIRLGKLNNYQKHLSNIFNNYAYLLMAEHNYDSARLVLTIALTIARDIKNIDLEASILDSFSDYYAAVDSTEKQLEYYKESIKLRNEFRHKQQIERSQFLATVFETEKKEQQLVIKDSELNRARFLIVFVVLMLIIAIAVIVIIRQKLIHRKAKLIAVEREKKLEVVNALIEGQDDERKRLAMDLHDLISAKMGILKMKISSGIKQNKIESDMLEELDNMHKEIRELSHKMLPPLLESQGLVFVTEHLIEEVKRKSEINFLFYSNINGRLSMKFEKNLYFIMNELINNAIKHSQATQVSVQLLTDKKTISLSVEDNGCGFDKKTVETGLGLQNIKQRVDYLGGELVIDTKIDHGTEIIVELNI